MPDLSWPKERIKNLSDVVRILGGSNRQRRIENGVTYYPHSMMLSVQLVGRPIVFFRDRWSRLMWLPTILLISISFTSWREGTSHSHPETFGANAIYLPTLEQSLGKSFSSQVRSTRKDGKSSSRVCQELK